MIFWGWVDDRPGRGAGRFQALMPKLIVSPDTNRYDGGEKIVTRPSGRRSAMLPPTSRTATRRGAAFLRREFPPRSAAPASSPATSSPSYAAAVLPRASSPYRSAARPTSVTDPYYTRRDRAGCAEGQGAGRSPGCRIRWLCSRFRCRVGPHRSRRGCICHRLRRLEQPALHALGNVLAAHLTCMP